MVLRGVHGQENPGAIEAITQAMEENLDLRVTIPNIVEDSVLKDLMK